MNGLHIEPRLLKGVTSTYLHRGRKRIGYLRGYGLHVTNDEIFGVRISGAYRGFMLLPLAIRTFAFVGITIILVGLLQGWSQPSDFQANFPIYLLPLGLSMVADLPDWIVEKRLKSFSQPRLDWMARGKDFAVSRDEISSIQFRWPGGLRVGHILFTTQSGPIRVWLTQPASRRGLVSELRDMLSDFCYQNPRIEFVEKI